LDTACPKIADGSAPQFVSTKGLVLPYLISTALPFGRLWYTKPDDAIGYAKHRSRSHHAVIRVYDATGNVIETHEQKGKLKEW
jgi:hypothetical protein